MLKRRGKDWSRRPGLNGRPAVYEIPRISPQSPNPTRILKPVAPEMDTDGAELSCPGSSVVAKEPSGEVGVD